MSKAEGLSYVCAVTGESARGFVKSNGAQCLPRGWKEHGGRHYCEAAWKKHYRLTAVTLPVVGPVPGPREDRETCNWEGLRTELNEMWRQTTLLSNWLIERLRAADVVRSAEMKKLPKQPQVKLYEEARARFPELPSNSLGATEHAVRGKYRKLRYNVIWRSDAQWPVFRYPQPFPLHAQNHRVVELPGGALGIACKVGKKRWTLRLRGGRDFARQQGPLREVLGGRAALAAGALYRLPASNGDHRGGVEDRKAGGGKRTSYRLMAKLVIWLPRKTRGERKGTLLVRTCPHSLLVARVEGARSNKWWAHRDDLVRRMAAHRSQLHRFAEDNKSEMRSARGRLAERREALCRKQNNRTDTALKQVAASLAGCAVRCRVARVVYDDRERGFLPSGPYAQLEAALRNALDRENIEFETLAEIRARKAEEKALIELAGLEAGLQEILDKENQR